MTVTVSSILVVQKCPIFSSEMMKRSLQAATKPIESASLFLNSCHSLADDSPVVKEHWPKQYQGGG